MKVYWLEQTEADVPSKNDWLGASEALRLKDMRFAKRRGDWRLGRWTAKCALAACLRMPTHPASLATIEIRPAPSGAPEVFVAEKPAAVTISLSHRAGIAVCALAFGPAELGCDLEVIEPRSDGFLADYFTTEEQALVARAVPADQALLLTLLWSGKESALKALRTGLRLDTRSVSVGAFDALDRPGEDGRWTAGDAASASPSSSGLEGWHRLQLRCTSGQTFEGWWRQTGNLLRTVVATSLPSPPLLLNLGRTSADGASPSN